MSRALRAQRREAIERKHISLHSFDDIEMLPVLVGGEIEQRQVTAREMGLPVRWLGPMRLGLRSASAGRSLPSFTHGAFEMTPEQAKKLLPVMQAFAGGKEVQYQHKNLVGSVMWFDATSPTFDLSFEWRVKPEKIVRWVNLYTDHVCLYFTKDEADAGANRHRIACIRIEFEEGEGL
jgi:hypothetical protein